MNDVQVDDDRSALAGQLGRCEGRVRSAFAELHEALVRTGLGLEKCELSRGGFWLARSYKVGGRTVCELHPKGSWVKVKVGSANVALAPRDLVPTGERRDGWLKV